MRPRGDGWRAASWCLAGTLVLGTGFDAPPTPPRTVIDLQPFRTTQTITIGSARGIEQTATLINVNPTIGVWYVLEVASKDGASKRAYHLENPRPGVQALTLDPRYTTGIVVTDGTRRYECEFFGGAPTTIERAVSSGPGFQPLCDGRLYLRNRASGRHTRLETATDLVRERIWGGETLLGLGHQVLGDRNLETGTVGSGTPGHPVGSGPLPARVSANAARQTVLSGNMGIGLVGSGSKGLAPGSWYAATGQPGVFVSILQPGMIDASILRGGETTVSALDEVESSSLCYLVAFDLDRFDLGYAGGTEHPGVGWSGHMQPQLREPQLPGPDGIGTIAPLVATGIVPPRDALRTMATFAGGFKRHHGAFLYGDFATRNRGTHYGFVENGVVLSTLQPGLSTLFVTADRRVEMKTWTDADRAALKHIRFARQNGVPIVEYDETAQTTIPGRLVNRWGPGNWSGSADMKLRTVRAGAAMQVNGRERYLIYAVFSAATPSAMARVFQAYRCRYAMLLDMNALELTYFALLRREASGMKIEYLIKGMGAADVASGGRVVARFVDAPDNRDFFYVMRREGTAP